MLNDAKIEVSELESFLDDPSSAVDNLKVCGLQHP
jgi:hypothetical protein